MFKTLFFFAAMLLFVSITDAKEKNVNEKNNKPMIIDVRTEQEYNAGNIEGSILIPYDVIGDKIADTAPNKNSKIILYCRSGRRSGIAEGVLKEMGYTNVENYGSMQSAKDKLGIK